jgi:hypothetical protein
MKMNPTNSTKRRTKESRNKQHKRIAKQNYHIGFRRCKNNETNTITKQNLRTEKLKRKTHRRSNNDGFSNVIGDFPRIDGGETVILIRRCKRWPRGDKSQMTLQRRPTRCSGSLPPRTTVGSSSATGHWHEKLVTIWDVNRNWSWKLMEMVKDRREVGF